jgi:molybdopterin-binding protein
MKIDARNILKGKVVDVQPGAITAKIKLDLGNGNCITSIVSLDWLEEMGIKIGDDASAIVKSTEVMIGK